MDKANPAVAEREAHLQNVEDALGRIAHHKGVLGYFIMEPQKGKLLSFAGFRGSSREAHRYADTLKGFIDLTASTVRTVDWKDELTFLRISCDSVDILVAPDANKEYTMVVVQSIKQRVATTVTMTTTRERSLTLQRVLSRCSTRSTRTASMYAVKPWGHVILVGGCVGTYAMGIGMRWRESNVTIVERRRGPSYERGETRRCVVTDQTVKLLTDLGCTEGKVRSILRPARGWRFLSPDLAVLREGLTFPGCAIGEAAYHCTEGALLRTLRSELLRFGGSVDWDTEAHGAYENNDGSDTWCVRKDYGLGTKVEAVVTMAKATPFAEMLVAPDPNRLAVLFDVERGVCKADSQHASAVLDQHTDVAIVVGHGMAMHVWRCSATECAWRLIRNATKHATLDASLDGTHDALRALIADSEQRSSTVCALPGTTPAIKDEAVHFRVGLLGDGLLPVDPFEWRGDNARCMIEEASMVCRLFYGKKYHRGDVAALLRGAEQDSISKRANLLQRDLQDAEHFLAVHPRLDSEPSTPELRRVGA